jgi:hypothetical protein
MAKRKEKELAIQLRLQGKSYSQIKESVHVSKSTLSVWLFDFPLSKERMILLRDRNPRRIERFRNTMKQKREQKERKAYRRAQVDINKINNRDLFIGGFFLYWGEGLKAAQSTVGISNTDPFIILYFISWLKLLGVHKKHLIIRLHLYKDMDIRKEILFWSKKIKIPETQFKKPYIKNTTSYNRTWKSLSAHGTCNVVFFDQKLHDYVLGGLQYLRDTYNPPV